MALTLTDLDFAFESMWQHKDQIPALLDTWHELLSEYLEAMDETTLAKFELKNRIEYWETAVAQYEPFNSVHYETSVMH